MLSRCVPAAVALVLLAVLPVAAAAKMVPSFPGRPEDVPAGAILPDTVIPLGDLRERGWTESQKKEVAYLLEMMKKDDRIFLLVQVKTDPIGTREDNEQWGKALADVVAGRLLASGIPPDRLMSAGGVEDGGLFDEPRWSGFAARQKVVIRAIQGGDWLRRPGKAVAVRETLPPEGTIRIVEPASSETDRSNHLLRGTADASVRTVAIVIGRESKTAAVYDGRFEVPISLLPGESRIVVRGLDRYGRALVAERTVRYSPPRPSIVITAPPPGAEIDITRNPVITVRGMVTSRTPVDRTVLIQNDLPGAIRLGPDGSFEQRAVLITEQDVFTVEASVKQGATGVSAPRQVSARGIAERPLMGILSWDGDDVDVDLHVTDHEGRHSDFAAPDLLRSATAIPSGRLWLDDRDGYGPEVFSVERQDQGSYLFAARYYRGRTPCKAYLTIILFAGSPSRRMVRLFGPISLSAAAPEAAIARVSLPDGTVEDLSQAGAGASR